MHWWPLSVCLSVRPSVPCLTLSREWKGVASWKLAERKPMTRPYLEVERSKFKDTTGRSCWLFKSLGLLVGGGATLWLPHSLLYLMIISLRIFSMRSGVPQLLWMCCLVCLYFGSLFDHSITKGTFVILWFDLSVFSMWVVPTTQRRKIAHPMHLQDSKKLPSESRVRADLLHLLYSLIGYTPL